MAWIFDEAVIVPDDGAVLIALRALQGRMTFRGIVRGQKCLVAVFVSTYPIVQCLLQLDLIDDVYAQYFDRRPISYLHPGNAEALHS